MLACPCEESPLIEARTTEFKQRMQNILVRNPIISLVDWPWPPMSNLTSNVQIIIWPRFRHQLPRLLHGLDYITVSTLCTYLLIATYLSRLLRNPTCFTVSTPSTHCIRLCSFYDLVPYTDLQPMVFPHLTWFLFVSVLLSHTERGSAP